MKSMSLSKHIETKKIRSDKMHEVDAKSAHTVLINQGHLHAEVTDSGLVLDVNDP